MSNKESSLGGILKSALFGDRQGAAVDPSEVEGAALRAWASQVLEKHDWPDEFQQKISNKIGRAIRSTEPLLIPTAKNIHDCITGISAAIQPLSIQVGDIDSFIESGVTQMTDRLSTNTHINTMKPPSEEERNIAMELWAEAGIVPPEHIHDELMTQVKASIRDWNAVKWVAYQEGKKRELEPIIQRIRTAVPESWFTVDPITDQAFFTKEERDLFRQTPGTTWGLSLRGIHLRQMTGSKESITITWDQIETSDHHGQNGIMILRNDPKFVETLRTLVGPRFYPLLDRFVALRGKVGMLVFVSTQEQEKRIIGSIMVRDTENTLRQMNDLAAMSRQITQVYEYVNAEYQQVSGSKSHGLIRPEVVRQLLPDPTILEIRPPNEEELRNRWKALRNAYSQLHFLRTQMGNFYGVMPKQAPPKELFPRNKRHVRWLESQERKILAWKYRINLIKTGDVYWKNVPLRIP